MIARDEAALLPGCLESARGAVDEVVLIDTGSLDNTVAIAAAAGARVGHFTWIDDFSAARNAALAACTGDWVLVLDADERLLPGAGARLRPLLEADRFDAAVLPWLNADALDAPLEAVASGARLAGEVAHVPRLFRRAEDLRWEGRVHELPASFLSAPGRRVQALNEPIIHLGNAPGYRALRQKDARNRRLLELQVAASPNNPTAMAQLANELLKDGEQAAAHALADAAWQRMQRSWSGPAPRPRPAPAATLAAFCALQRGDHPGALRVLRQAEAWIGPHPNLSLLEAAALDDAAELGGELSLIDAQRVILALRAHRGAPEAPMFDELLPGARGPAAARLEAELCLKLDRWAEAELALRAADGSPVAALSRARCAAEGPDPAAAAPLLAEAWAQNNPAAEVLRAQVALRVEGAPPPAAFRDRLIGLRSARLQRRARCLFGLAPSLPALRAAAAAAPPLALALERTLSRPEDLQAARVMLAALSAAAPRLVAPVAQALRPG